MSHRPKIFINIYLLQQSQNEDTFESVYGLCARAKYFFNCCFKIWLGNSYSLSVYIYLYTPPSTFTAQRILVALQRAFKIIFSVGCIESISFEVRSIENCFLVSTSYSIAANTINICIFIYIYIWYTAYLIFTFVILKPGKTHPNMNGAMECALDGAK